MHRRDLLKASAALALAGIYLPRPAAASDAPTRLKTLGKAQPFDYAWLKGRAREMAQQPYKPVTDQLPARVAALDWDQYQAIGYRDDHALWGSDKLRFQVKFFHLGLFFKQAVQIHEVVDGTARELAYDPEMFNYGKSGLMAGNCRKTWALPASASISIPT